MKDSLFHWADLKDESAPRFLHGVDWLSRLPIVLPPPAYFIPCVDPEALRDLAGYQWATSIEPSQLAAVTWLDGMRCARCVVLGSDEESAVICDSLDCINFLELLVSPI